MMILELNEMSPLQFRFTLSLNDGCVRIILNVVLNELIILKTIKQDMFSQSKIDQSSDLYAPNLS